MIFLSKQMSLGLAFSITIALGLVNSAWGQLPSTPIESEPTAFPTVTVPQAIPTGNLPTVPLPSGRTFPIIETRPERVESLPSMTGNLPPYPATIPYPYSSTPPLVAMPSEPVPEPAPIKIVAEEKVKYPTVKLTGQFQLDAVYDIQSVRSRAVVGDVASALDFRRARIGGVGNLSENITYHLEFDFAASQTRFVDNWVTFGKVPVVGNIRLGRYRQPFGMDELTSSRVLPFLERTSLSTLAPFRQSGIMAFDAVADDRITYAVSGYRYNSDPFGNVLGDNGGYGLATRVTAIPYIVSDSHLMHIGADYSLNDPSEPNEIRFRSSPEIRSIVTAGNVLAPSVNSLPPFVDTGILTVGQNHHFNVEAAYVNHNFALQGEARAVVVDQTNGNSHTIGGFYTHARYVLTGEDIPYDKKRAIFGRVKPRRGVDDGGMGAWELAFRWSFIDLGGLDGVTDNGPDAVPAPGRKLNNLTLGLNWYLVEHAKFQFNYIHSILDDRTFGVTNTDFFGLRCQMDF